MGINVLVTGGTGYIGRRVVDALVARGHRVRVLARKESLGRVSAGATPVEGNALETSSLIGALKDGDSIVHLVGTPHPNPLKADEFRRVDLASIRATLEACGRIRNGHLVYVSVAQPAPVMKAYVATRIEGETLIREAGITATILRPWYVIGPGHWWPLVLLPFYWIAMLVPGLAPGARRLGLVSLRKMVRALVHSAENPPEPGTIRVLDVPTIRRYSSLPGSYARNSTAG